MKQERPAKCHFLATLHRQSLPFGCGSAVLVPCHNQAVYIACVCCDASCRKISGCTVVCLYFLQAFQPKRGEQPVTKAKSPQLATRTRARPEVGKTDCAHPCLHITAPSSVCPCVLQNVHSLSDIQKTWYRTLLIARMIQSCTGCRTQQSQAVMRPLCFKPNHLQMAQTQGQSNG